MQRPVIGIIGNHSLLDGTYPAYTSGEMNMAAISCVAEAMPLVVPPHPDFIDLRELLEVCDGFLLTGGRPNVHPEEYGEEPTEAHGDFDRARDAITLPLVRECVRRGQPILGICRGFQEMNVAMGGSLHPEIRELPGRMNHRMPPEGTLDEKFALRHKVTVSQGGPFHALFGATEVMTNTLHGQGIKTTGPRIVVDGHAEDGTPEALYIKDAPGFAMAVQWHPEYQAARDPVSRPLFQAFGAAARAWKEARKEAGEHVGNQAGENSAKGRRTG